MSTATLNEINALISNGNQLVASPQADPDLYVAEITTPVGQGFAVNQSRAYDAVIPEPNSLLLLAAGLIGLQLLRRRPGSVGGLASA